MEAFLTAVILAVVAGLGSVIFQQLDLTVPISLYIMGWLGFVLGVIIRDLDND